MTAELEQPTTFALDRVLNVRVRLLNNRPEGLPIPSYATQGSAGLDIPAAEACSLEPGARVLINTGLSFDIPQGFEGQLRPRSGLAFKYGVTLLNSPGTIDSDFRGELRVLLVNFGQERFDVQIGDRIAQLVFAPVVQANLEVVTELDMTSRGVGGFGHSGR